MKLTENTIAILKNFSTINNTLLVRPGSELTTMAAPSRAIYAKAIVEETFPQQFAIYELNQLIGALSLFDEPELEFGDKQLTIASGRQRVNFSFADPSMVIAPPERGVKFEDHVIEFDLAANEFTRLVRAAGVFRLPNITITCDGDVVRINAADANNTSNNSFGIDVGHSDCKFNMIIDVQNIIRLLQKDYNVKITSRGICKFESDTITYYVMCEHDSKFTKGD